MEAPMPAVRWWLAQPGQQPLGPFPRDEIAVRVRDAGGVGDWQVCREGESSWLPLLSEPTIAAAVAAALAGVGMPAPPNPSVPPPVPGVPAVAGENRSLLVFIHLGIFAGYVIPVAGLVLPLVLWLVNREKPGVDLHGKEVMNWIIFVLIAGIACLPLAFCGIGLVLAVVLSLAVVVCAIIGAVKASNGELFRYPMPFRLIR